MLRLLSRASTSPKFISRDQFSSNNFEKIDFLIANSTFTLRRNLKNAASINCWGIFRVAARTAWLQSWIENTTRSQEYLRNLKNCHQNQEVNCQHFSKFYIYFLCVSFCLKFDTFCLKFDIFSLKLDSLFPLSWILP